jgi:hypothetical protein
MAGVADYELRALYCSCLDVAQQELVQCWDAAQHSAKILCRDAQGLARDLHDASIWCPRGSKNKRHSNEVHMAERSDLQSALLASSRQKRR